MYLLESDRNVHDTCYRNCKSSQVTTINYVLWSSHLLVGVVKKRLQGRNLITLQKVNSVPQLCCDCTAVDLNKVAIKIRTPL